MSTNTQPRKSVGGGRRNRPSFKQQMLRSLVSFVMGTVVFFAMLIASGNKAFQEILDMIKGLFA